MMPKADKAND